MPDEEKELQHIRTQIPQTGDKQISPQAIEIKRDNQAQPFRRVLGVKHVL